MLEGLKSLFCAPKEPEVVYPQVETTTNEYKDVESVVRLSEDNTITVRVDGRGGTVTLKLRNEYLYWSHSDSMTVNVAYLQHIRTAIGQVLRALAEED
jgi:hypothetical protein